MPDLTVGAIARLRALRNRRTRERPAPADATQGISGQPSDPVLPPAPERVPDPAPERVPINYSGQDLRGRDFSGNDLTNADLTRADLTRADLYGEPSGTSACIAPRTPVPSSLSTNRVDGGEGSQPVNSSRSRSKVAQRRRGVLRPPLAIQSEPHNFSLFDRAWSMLTGTAEAVSLTRS